MTIKPLTNSEVQEILEKAVQKIATLNESSNDSEPLVFLQSYFMLLQTLSKSNNDTPGLRSMGLEQGMNLAREVVSLNGNSLAKVRFDMKSIARGINFS